jgi:hypothetical protein
MSCIDVFKAPAWRSSPVKLADALREMGILQLPEEATDFRKLMSVVIQHSLSFRGEFSLERMDKQPDEREWQTVSVRAVVKEREALLKFGFAVTGRLMFWSREFI